MAILTRAYSGIAWSAAGGGLQLVVRLFTFLLIASRLAPEEIGAFAIAAMIAGLAEIVTARPFGDSLQQRQEIRPAHLNATFLTILPLTLVAAGLVMLAAPFLARGFDSPLSAQLLTVLIVFVPLSCVSVVNDAILIRDMRFDILARAGASGTIVSGCVAIALMLAGAGVWSLVAADIAGRVYRLVYLWHAARYRPSLRTDRAAFTDLVRFNLHSVLTYILGFLDSVAPRALTGLLLGPGALGFLVIAQRFMELLGALVLAPISSVTMASVARLQDKPAELKRLIISLYRLAALVGYPAFIGAALIVPDLALLFGDKWVPAILIAQLLLLRGIRLTTGVFNIAILRGVGHSGAPLVLLGAGLALNLLLIPPAAMFGLTGIALAMLMRTILTWPVGLVLVERATGVSVMRQLLAGSRHLVCALLMAACVWAGLHAWQEAGHLLRASLAAASGGLIYLGLLALSARQSMVAAVCLLRDGENARAFERLRMGLGL